MRKWRGSGRNCEKRNHSQNILNKISIVRKNFVECQITPHLPGNLGTVIHT